MKSFFVEFASTVHDFLRVSRKALIEVPRIREIRVLVLRGFLFGRGRSREESSDVPEHELNEYH